MCDLDSIDKLMYTNINFMSTNECICNKQNNSFSLEKKKINSLIHEEKMGSIAIAHCTCHSIFVNIN